MGQMHYQDEVISVRQLLGAELILVVEPADPPHRWIEPKRAAPPDEGSPPRPVPPGSPPIDTLYERYRVLESLTPGGGALVETTVEVYGVVNKENHRIAHERARGIIHNHPIVHRYLLEPPVVEERRSEPRILFLRREVFVPGSAGILFHLYPGISLPTSRRGELEAARLRAKPWTLFGRIANAIGTLWRR